MKPWEKYQKGEGPWSKYQPKAETPQQSLGAINQNPQFSDEPIYGEAGVQVGNPSYGARTALNIANAIDQPRQAILGSTPVTEADPYYVGQKGGLSPYDIAGGVAKGILGQGAASEAAPYDISKPEDFKKIAEIAGKAGLDFATMGPYYGGLSKVLGGMTEIGRTAQNFTKKIAKTVEDNIWKAIRPGKRGMIGFQDQQRYLKNATTAIEDIVANKGGLVLKDSHGYEIKNTIPRNLRQMSQAIEQRLKVIGKEIEAPIKELSATGGMVDTNKIADKLMQDMTTEGVLVGDDMAYKHAIKQAEILRNAGKGTGRMSPSDALEAIKRTNAKIGSQLRSGKKGYTLAGQGYVDYYKNVLLREELDNMVNQLKGTRWQPIRDKYAAYKTIEEDTLRRALVFDRANKKGIMDVSDVFTGYHGMRGLLQWEPSTLGAAGGAKIVAAYQKYLANPNRYVKNMFKEVESLMSKRDALTAPIPPPKPKTPKQPPKRAIPKRLENRGGAPIELGLTKEEAKAKDLTIWVDKNGKIKGYYR